MLAAHLRPKTATRPTVPPYDVLPNSDGIIDGMELLISVPWLSGQMPLWRVGVDNRQFQNLRYVPYQLVQTH